jgi:acetyl esterase/lipase
MVFLHGGGFRQGAPGPVGHYGRPILDAGGIFVSLGYRLAPDLRFPDMTEDAELGLDAISGLAAKRGAQSSSLYLSGHSAGAALGAITALRPQTRMSNALAGLVLVSGMYDFTQQAEEVSNHASARYVPDLTAAIEHVPPHTIVIAGDRDLPAVMPAAQAMIAALQERDASIEFFVEEDADHFEAIRGFATAGTPTSTSVLQMMGLG